IGTEGTIRPCYHRVPERVYSNPMTGQLNDVHNQLNVNPASKMAKIYDYPANVPGKSPIFSQHTCSITCFSCALNIAIVWSPPRLPRAATPYINGLPINVKSAAYANDRPISGPERRPLSIITFIRFPYRLANPFNGF